MSWRGSREPVAFEADAIARPDRIIHPVDLGTILLPNDWLLLADGQKGTVDVAAICRSGDVPNAREAAWFESSPAAKTASGMALVKDRRAQISLPLPPAPATVDHDVLQVSIVGRTGPSCGTRRSRPWWSIIRPSGPSSAPWKPSFATMRPFRCSPATASSLRCATPAAGIPSFKDVVVTMPNGTRFVFWRGSCYIPFWASRHNAGFCYEWAEGEPAADAVDCVEPLMDKELRYGRVRIVESTPARVHVRWSYQSCDFNYKVWGDSAVEDYYFYPDGFGTRVLTLQSDPQTANYELSEFIVLTPQSTYPLEHLPVEHGGHSFHGRSEAGNHLSVLPERARREEEDAQHAGDLPRAPAQGRTAGGDLLQSAR